MLTAKETQLILEKFFNDCLRFWSKDLRLNRYQTFEKALDDTKHILTDPYSPKGDKLDEETRIKFIQYREMDLGRR